MKEIIKESKHIKYILRSQGFSEKTNFMILEFLEKVSNLDCNKDANFLYKIEKKRRESIFRKLDDAKELIKYMEQRYDAIRKILDKLNLEYIYENLDV
jgi:hypothetical protein